MTDQHEDDASIRVRGARVHNLKGVNVEIPRDKLVVLTGVSGSGKSSLAFDTIHAEGQRRYVEGLSGYARQFLDLMERPDVDSIDGLPPTVAIDQKAGSTSPRSTVGTVTEVLDYLRLLYARAGIPHCPKCGQEIRRQTPEQMVAGALALGEGRKVLVLAPIVRGKKGQHAAAFDAIRRAGLLRARVDGEMTEIGDAPPILAKTKVHTIEAVVDRLIIREGIRPRLAESIDLALKIGDGTVLLSWQTPEGGWEDRVLSIRHACPSCGTSIAEIEPRTFSFNSPLGACPDCDGLGVIAVFDPESVVPDLSKSVESGAVAPWDVLYATKSPVYVDSDKLSALYARLRLSPGFPLAKWPREAVRLFLQGDPISGFEGVLAGLEREWASANDRKKAMLAPFRTESTCNACQGARLRPEARGVTLGGSGSRSADQSVLSKGSAGQGLPHEKALAIQELCERTTTEAAVFLESLAFEPPMDLVGLPLIREVVDRLRFLDRVGLGYLSLSRKADTLSGGELQRVRLASQIGSGLVGVAFVLDEPTAGLHPSDTDRLLSSLIELRDRGNSVLVVEHDETMIRSADWVVDIGPGAGPDGGRVVAEGSPTSLGQSADSITASWLSGSLRIAPCASDRLARSPGWIDVVGAREHNLKGDLARFPIGALTSVTGVSGSGKSSLIFDVLARAGLRTLERVGPRPGTHDRVSGIEGFERIVLIDQAPIGHSPRSTPATATGVFDEIRRVFAQTREAKIRGYKANRFSFNVKGGRCESCLGQGVRRIEMNFLPDLSVTCETCGGRRFNRATLEVRFKGHSIGDVLGLRVDGALSLFDGIPRVRRGLESLQEAGLGYVTLGQSSTTLSGGESQRVKLATELIRPAFGRSLYLLDEPTTGLHAADVANLLGVLQRLADLGHTLIVIEHNLDVVRSSDWVVDLGPGAGPDGGHVVAMGTPIEVAAFPESVTGRYLKHLI